MGVLDKYRIRGAVNTRFNPGRNNNWDWNELLTTIENNFEANFDLDALDARVTANTGKIDTNDAAIGVNTTAIANNVNAIAANLEKNNIQETEIAALNLKLQQLCACLISKVEGFECPACGK